MAKTTQDHSDELSETAEEKEAIQQAEADLPEGETDHANYVSKITISTMNCNPGQAKADNARVAVCRIGGIATSCKIVPHPVSGEEFIALVGQFFGENLQKGTMWRSGVCYLPGGYHENIVEALEEQEGRRKLAEDDPNRRSKFEPVQVAFDMAFDAQPAKNPIGYSYIARSLMPVTKADPLAQMIARGRRVLAALPAPQVNPQLAAG